MSEEAKEIKFRRLDKDAKMPMKRYGCAAAFDLFSNTITTIRPGSSAVIMTDLQVELPPDVYGRIESRSGLAFREDLVAFNGVIDSDFRYVQGSRTMSITV